MKHTQQDAPNKLQLREQTPRQVALPNPQSHVPVVSQKHMREKIPRRPQGVEKKKAALAAVVPGDPPWKRSEVEIKVERHNKQNKEAKTQPESMATIPASAHGCATWSRGRVNRPTKDRVESHVTTQPGFQAMARATKVVRMVWASLSQGISCSFT